MSVLMFPGQGSQVKGMGESLFSKYPDFCRQANEVLGYDIIQLCLDNPENKLNNTQFTQPALFFVEALSFLDQNDIGARYSIGHSLGEYAALFSAGMFDLETGLRLVQKRGELMSKAEGGGMMAVINLSEERINQLLQNHGLNSVTVANKNSPKQFVISGPEKDIHASKEILSAEAMMCIPLNVSGAFHSNLMKEASEEFEHFIASFTFNQPEKEVLSNVNLQCYTLENIIPNLVNQITSPVRWSDTIAKLKQLGETEFLEIGPGNVLTRLLAQN